MVRNSLLLAAVAFVVVSGVLGGILSAQREIPPISLQLKDEVSLDVKSACSWARTRGSSAYERGWHVQMNPYAQSQVYDANGREYGVLLASCWQDGWQRAKLLASLRYGPPTIGAVLREGDPLPPALRPY